MIKISWDKNTVNSSEINGIIRILNNLKISYTITELGSVVGMGLNDDDNKSYILRKLEYKDAVIMEQMIRSTDCDMDDVIASVSFDKGQEPLEWKLERAFDNKGNEIDLEEE